MTTPVVDTLGATIRAEHGRCLATLVGILGDIDLAEDALAEAAARALERWPRDGIPDRPGAWLTTVARRHAIDRLRRAARGRELHDRLAHDPTTPSSHEHEEVVEPVDDDQLRLLFTCCHPALSQQAQVALTLRLLTGLSTQEVADAFLVSESAMAQRLTRARRKIREASIPFRVPPAQRLPDRLHAVLMVLYLSYNAEGAAVRAEAIRLARLLHRLMPDEPEAAGLLALLLLTESRWPSRRDAAGRVVLLRDQDRSRWDSALIQEGHDLVRACLRRDEPGPYQLQAAIGAVHADATTFQQTDWHQIVELYDQLLDMTQSPVAALNRAIAVGEVEGPVAALALVEQLDLDGYQPLHATRADLLRRLDRNTEAAREFERAAALASDPAVATHLDRERQQL